MDSKMTVNQEGFTIIELMIATVVFSVILLTVSVSLIQIGRMYYKGVNSALTQNTARTIIDDISRPIQFAGQDVIIVNPTAINGINTGAFCIGGKRYTYGLNAQVTDDPSIDGTYNTAGTHKARHAFWQDTITTPAACVAVDLTQATPQPPSVDPTVQGTNGQELLGQNMRLKDFTLTKQGHIWNINLKVLYGDDDLISFSDAAHTQPDKCIGLPSGDQWCALSELSTQVVSRIQ